MTATVRCLVGVCWATKIFNFPDFPQRFPAGKFKNFLERAKDPLQRGVQQLASARWPREREGERFEGGRVESMASLLGGSLLQAREGAHFKQEQEGEQANAPIAAARW